MKKEKNIQDKIIDDWSLSDKDLLEIIDDELDEYYEEKRIHAVIHKIEAKDND